MSSENFFVQKLAELTSKIGSGATPRGGKENYLEKGEYALVRSQNILDFSFSPTGLVFIDKVQARLLENVSLEERDVLINITGDSVARVCQCPNAILPARVNQHVAILRPIKEKLNPEYLKYYLLQRHIKELLLSFSAVGATRNALTKSMLEEFEIRVPNVTAQTRIASILSCLDDKIELNRQTNKTLEEIAQTLFKEMCLPKGDVLPEGWRMGKLGEIVKIQMGQSPPGESYNTKGLGFVFFQGKAEFGFRYPVVDKYTSKPKKIANKMDVLLSVRAPVGAINVAMVPCCIGRGLASLSSISGNQSFVYYLLDNLKEKFKLFNGEGTVFGSINKEALSGLDIIIPPEEIVSEYNNLSNSLDTQIFNFEQEIQTLTTLRDTLLPKLMKGEIEV